MIRNTGILSLIICLLCCQLSFAKDKIKVACVGNSITYGTGLADRDTEAYPVRLQEMLGDGYIVGNFGKPGATLLNKGIVRISVSRNMSMRSSLPAILW